MVKGLYGIVENSNQARSLLQGGVELLQLRIKNARRSTLDAKEVFDVAKNIMRLKKDFNFTFIINNHLEIAKELKADGYHGGVGDPSIEEARLLLGGEAIIGYSSHSLEEAKVAEQQGANYVAFGAIYESKTKTHPHPVQGVERLREVVKALRVPVVAIGGINRNNVKEVLATGVQGIAMISALLSVPDTVNEAKFYGGFFA